MKKTIVKILCLVTALALTAGLTACGKTGGEGGETSSPVTDAATATDTAAATASDSAAATASDSEAETEPLPEVEKFYSVSWESAPGHTDKLIEGARNLGDLSLGKNSVTLNSGCYAFVAEKTGYYNIDTDKMTEAAEAKNMTGNTVKTENTMMMGFPGAFYDGLWYYAGEEMRDTLPLYLERGDLIYARFYDIDYENDALNDGSGVVTVNYLGEISGANFDLGDICLDDCMIEDDRVALKANKPIDITFTEGQRFKKTYLSGTADSIAPGDHEMNVELTKGRGFRTKVRFYRLEDVIEKVDLPGSYIPMVSLRIGETSGNVAVYPEYINVTFKDGTVRKAGRRIVSEGDNYSVYDFNCKGEAYNTLELDAVANSSGRPVLRVIYNSNGERAVLAEYDAIRA